MATLAIETSTARGSVAVWLRGELLFNETFAAERRHSAALFSALERARGSVSRIEQIAVGLGPGSYAGVRIAIAAAMGLQLSLGARLVGLPSVAVFDTASPNYLAAGDARRDMFYFAAVDAGVCIDGPRLASEEEVRLAVDQFGTWPFYMAEKLVAFPTGTIAFPSAAVLARQAAEERGILQTGDLDPIYLREPHISQPKPVGPPPTRGPVFR